MARTSIASIMFLTFGLGIAGSLRAADDRPDFSPPPEEQQLPTAMHSAMDQLPCITAGREDADLIGADNRVLQAAVDYIAGLGGGLVEIGAGEYLMHDSLHLRSNVTVRGVKGRTILRKAPSAVSALALDGDFGEQQITVEDAKGLAPGYGVAVWDDNAGGFHTTVARITGQKGHTFAIDKPLMADCMVDNHAKAATVFPVISAYHAQGIRIEDVTIDGNKADNIALNGCRGAGIFLYGSHGATIQGCTIRGYNGDGISFQQSNDVAVTDCVSEDNVSLGLHPGSGSQRPTVQRCIARRNGTDGLFLCWRVRHGTFENNILEENGRFGISIGHKDSDNLLRHNVVRSNKENGIFFRNESLGMAPHRNRLEENVVENNGGAEIRIRGAVNDLVFRNNVIRDSRTQDADIGIQIEETVGPIVLDNNRIETQTSVDDRRSSKQK
jgi:parallel beta-helix repeat protein